MGEFFLAGYSFQVCQLAAAASFFELTLIPLLCTHSAFRVQKRCCAAEAKVLNKLQCNATAILEGGRGGRQFSIDALFPIHSELLIVKVNLLVLKCALICLSRELLVRDRDRDDSRRVDRVPLGIHIRDVKWGNRVRHPKCLW